jgi:hypothetical protein
MKKTSFVVAFFVAAALVGCGSKNKKSSTMSGDQGSAMGSATMGSDQGSAATPMGGSDMGGSAAAPAGGSGM